MVFKNNGKLDPRNYRVLGLSSILAVILINNMQRPSDSHVVVSLVVDSDIGGEIERRVHFGLSWEGEKNRCR